MAVSAIQQLAVQLKKAREIKGLSQRALAERVGIPQGHLSRIENGAVDLQTSNLIQIARALDLELTLVPRGAIPAVEALKIREPIDAPDAYRRRARINLLHSQATEAARKFPRVAILKRLVQTTLELSGLPPGLPPAEAQRLDVLLEQIGRTVRVLNSNATSISSDRSTIQAIEAQVSELQSLGNAIDLWQADRPGSQRPAYTLDEQGDD